MAGGKSSLLAQQRFSSLRPGNCDLACQKLRGRRGNESLRCYFDTTESRRIWAGAASVSGPSPRLQFQVSMSGSCVILSMDSVLPSSLMSHTYRTVMVTVFHPY